MHDLIRALKIFSKYETSDLIHCEHDVMYVCISPEKVSEQDKVDLEDLGFFTDGDDYQFYSFRFGSC